MSRKLDKLVVVDLEATCWNTQKEQRDQKSEIIEIGVCLLDLQTLEPEQKTSYLVRPRFSTISQFCTDLTTITADMLKEEGHYFNEVVNTFKKDFGLKYRTWCSWGAYDRVQFERNCEMYQVKYPFGRNHINMKNLYSLRFGLSKELGMMKALEHADIKPEGTHHRGHDDAWNIAKLAAKVLER